MKLHYEVEWELDDEFINDLVNEVEEVIKNLRGYENGVQNTIRE